MAPARGCRPGFGPRCLPAHADACINATNHARALSSPQARSAASLTGIKGVQTHNPAAHACKHGTGKGLLARIWAQTLDCSCRCMRKCNQPCQGPVLTPGKVCTEFDRQQRRPDPQYSCSCLQAWHRQGAAAQDLGPDAFLLMQMHAQMQPTMPAPCLPPGKVCTEFDRHQRRPDPQSSCSCLQARHRQGAAGQDLGPDAFLLMQMHAQMQSTMPCPCPHPRQGLQLVRQASEAACNLGPI